jgi:hypothetical protein
LAASNSAHRDWFFVGLATLSFVADLYTVYQIIAKEIVFDFWTWRWVISIVLVVLLSLGGFLFLGIGSSEKSVDSVLFVFGVLYSICALMVYLFWAYRSVDEQGAPGDFFGFLVLFAILAVVGVYSIGIGRSAEALLFPSYGFATASLAHVVLLVNHYVGNGSSFAFWSFAGQIVVLVVGVVLFAGLFLIAEGKLDDLAERRERRAEAAPSRTPGKPGQYRPASRSRR